MSDVAAPPDRISTACSPDAFRAAMRRMAGTVCVVTALDGGGERCGITATSVTSVSAEPPALLVCVNRASAVHGALTRGRLFCVNVLSADQEETARLFAAAASQDERFAEAGWRAGQGGVPVLDGCQATFVCEVAERHAFATHTVFIGIVVEAAAATAGAPLIYHDGRYRS